MPFVWLEAKPLKMVRNTMVAYYVKPKPSARTLPIYRIREHLLIKYNLHENFLNNSRIDSSKDLTQVNFAATASLFCQQTGGNM